MAEFYCLNCAPTQPQFVVGTVVYICKEWADDKFGTGDDLFTRYVSTWHASLVMVLVIWHDCWWNFQSHWSLCLIYSRQHIIRESLYWKVSRITMTTMHLWKLCLPGNYIHMQLANAGQFILLPVVDIGWPYGEHGFWSLWRQLCRAQDNFTVHLHICKLGWGAEQMPARCTHERLF